MAGGIFTVLGLFVLLPLMFGHEAAQRFHAMHEDERNLTRAANGFATAVLSLAALVWLAGVSYVWFFVIPLIAGLVRFGAGFKRCRGMRLNILRASWNLTK